MVPSGGPALPTFFVIGAAKCGTTSLHHYLDLHPEIGMSRVKEPHYFMRPEKGEGWYRSLFDASFRVRGESSVGYTLAPRGPGVPERIKAAVPTAKLVYLVRDPIERFVSDYLHRVSDGVEARSLEEVARSPRNTSEGDRGRYYYQIQQYLAHFDRSRLLVLTSEGLAHRRRETLSAVFAFLGVAAEVWGPEYERVLHESRFFRRKGAIGRWLRRVGNSNVASLVPADIRREIGKIAYRPFSRTLERPTLSEEATAHLAAYYRDDVAALREFLDDPLSEWSI
ncbi:MAG: sulfotransferase [Gemmatimonadota bacterium]